MIRVDRVGDGPLVVTDPVPGSRSVSIGAWVGVGSRDEPAAHAGVCHFLEHLLFKGTADRSALDLARSVERAGGELDAFTSREHTVLHARFPARHADLAVEILGAVLAAPALREDDIEVERSVILEELAATRDVPEEEAYLCLYESLFPDHGLGRDSLGTHDTISSIGRSEIAAFFGDEFTSDRMVVAASGAVDHDRFLGQVGELVPTRSSSGPLLRVPTAPAIGQQIEHRRDCEQGQLVLAWPGLSAADPDRHVYAVLTQILGGGMASRLFQRVREDRGWAYSVYASTAAFSDTGVVLVGAATAPGRLDAVTDLVLDEVSDLRANGPDADELATAIGALTGSTELAVEDPGARMFGHGAAMVERGEPMDVDDELAGLSAVTAGDVTDLAQRLLVAEPTRVAIRPE
ncbi:MAG: pitrilysin family protein [Actinomycetota bacterium]